MLFIVIGTCEQISDATEYRRQARRLRHLHADNPLRLHRSLRQLAESCDRARHMTQASPPVARASQPCERRSHGRDARATDNPSVRTRAKATAARQHFADTIAQTLAGHGAILRYSQRLALLNFATILRIPRFEANLIIAMVQYRHRATDFQAVQEQTAPPIILIDDSTRRLQAPAAHKSTLRRTLLLYAATFAVVQTAITLAALRLIGS